MLPRHPLAIRSSLRPLSSPFRRPPHIRSFHASRPRHGILDVSHQIFQDIHSFTGLSWTASILLTAALFRFSFTPFQLFINLRAKRNLSVKSLQDARKKIALRQAASLQARGSLAGSIAPKALAPAAWASIEIKQRDTELRERYKLPSVYTTYFAAIAFLPVWITNFAVLQSMCGIENGIFRLFLSPASFPPKELGFDLEGPLTDALCEADHTFVFPFLLVCLQYITINRAFPSSLIDKQKDAIRTLSQTSLPYLQGSFWIQFYQFMWITPILIGSFMIVIDAPVAVGLYLCSSAASQAVLSPLISKVSNVKKPPSAFMPQIPQLKRRYRSTMHQMDIFRPPGPSQSSSPSASYQPGANQYPEGEASDLDDSVASPSTPAERPKLKASVPRVRK